MSFQQHPRVSASPPLDFITARPISQIASPLLLKRLQQQKKKLAEGSKVTSPVSTGERTLECHSPTTNNDQMAPTKPTPPSARSNPSRRGDGNRRIEGMGAREMDQYLSKLKKENFDLKLTLYHSREKSAKTEHEFAETHAQLTGALSRNTELTELNDQLYAELEARDQALGDAVRMITTYEDRVAELERLLGVGNDPQHNYAQREEVRTEVGRQDESESPTVLNPEEDGSFNDGRNCGNKSEIPDCLTVGVSPFTHRPSPRLATPFRPRAPGSGGRFASPSPSVNSNLIDLDTPVSSSKDASSFLRSAFACIDTHTPLRSRAVSSNMSFINRCSSVMSDSPGGLQTGQSPDDDFVLDSPRLSELSDSSFASMYGGRDDGDASGGFEDEGGMFSDNCDNSIFREMSARIDMARGSETPNRRISPRREIIGFKARGRESGSSVFARNVLPPTPESISPRKCDGFKLIDGEVPASRLPHSPVSSSEGKSIMTSRCSTYGTDVSDGSLTTSGINTPSTPPPREYEEQGGGAKASCGNQKSPLHRSPSFADITNTQKTPRCRNRLSRGEGARKSTGKVESLVLPRHVDSRIGGVRGGCSGRQSASLKAPPPPVKINATFTSPPANIHTPPWTPRTPDSETAKRDSRTLPVIKRKDSWESIGSSLEKHDVRGKGNRGGGVSRRNTIALASNIATPPKKKVDTPNPTLVVDKRKSSIPALIRSNTTGSRDTKGASSKPVKEKCRRNVN